MNRAEFFDKIGPLAADRVREILWTVYWRGSAGVRERVEEALAPPSARPKTKPETVIDSTELFDETRRFVALARSGAYIGGTRDVHRTERSKWRVTYRRLVDDATKAVASGDLGHGAGALEALLDLACELYHYNYFHSDDPVAAMRLVVSDKVQLLWVATIEREGFPAFVRRAMPQLIRWESRYGWTRCGGHPICANEMPLADVMANLLRGRGLDPWITVADAYIEALTAAPKLRRALGQDERYELKRRTEKLAGFHDVLLDRLIGTEAEDRLDRIASQAQLVGPELGFLKAKLAHRRGDVAAARALVATCLAELPGHRELLELAKQIKAPLPPRAKELAQRRGSYV